MNDTKTFQLDGAAVTNGAITQAAGLPAFDYRTTNWLASGSTHSVTLVFADSGGVYQTNNLSFSVDAMNLQVQPAQPPDASLLGELLVQHRQRTQRLRGDLPRVGEDRQLTAAGADHDAPGEEVVAEVLKELSK